MLYLCAMNIKDTLLSSAFELFQKYGIKSVSMDDISKKLGISKKTIYNCVATKDDLISDILEKHLAQDEKDIKLIQLESSDAIDEMVNITTHIIKFLRGMTPSIIYDLKKYHPSSWKKIEHVHFTFIEQTIFNNLVRGQKESLYRKDFNPKVISKLYVIKSMAIADQDKFPIDEYDKILLLKEMIRYHLQGIASDQGVQLIQEKHKTFFNL
ncbi:MAG: TetR/AcrR family transcriptional regulator [Saprospiraceae bacterium]